MEYVNLGSTGLRVSRRSWPSRAVAGGMDRKAEEERIAELMAIRFRQGIVALHAQAGLDLGDPAVDYRWARLSSLVRRVHLREPDRHERSYWRRRQRREAPVRRTRSRLGICGTRPRAPVLKPDGKPGVSRK